MPSSHVFSLVHNIFTLGFNINPFKAMFHFGRTKCFKPIARLNIISPVITIWTVYCLGSCLDNHVSILKKTLEFPQFVACQTHPLWGQAVANFPVRVNKVLSYLHTENNATLFGRVTLKRLLKVHTDSLTLFLLMFYFKIMLSN